MATPPEALVVEQIAGFAARARPDSLGCALGALPGEPFVKLRQQFDAFGRGGRCTLIGGGPGVARPGGALQLRPRPLC
jgi:hypothetical protein